MRVNAAKGTLTYITDVVGLAVTPVVYTIEMAEFLRESANYHERLADIVRRLAEQGSIGDRALLYDLVQDAATLWQEYREDPK